MSCHGMVCWWWCCVCMQSVQELSHLTIESTSVLGKAAFGYRRSINAPDCIGGEDISKCEILPSYERSRSGAGVMKRVAHKCWRTRWRLKDGFRSGAPNQNGWITMKQSGTLNKQWWAVVQCYHPWDISCVSIIVVNSPIIASLPLGLLRLARMQLRL